MPISRSIRPGRAQFGAVLIEFAIIVPFLLLLVIGISEFSYAYYHLNILNKAVQDGAQYFSDARQARNGNFDNPIDVSGSNQTNLDATKNLVIYGHIDSTDLSPIMPINDATDFDVSITKDPNDATAQHIKITAVYNHNLITSDLLSGLMNFFSGGNGAVGPVIPLTASSVMRVEGG